MSTKTAQKVLKRLSGKLDPRYPLVLVDVGAMGGIARKWDVLAEDARVLAFEADEREYQKLSNSDRVKYLNYLIHGQSQDLTFFISKEPGKSSVYPPNLPVLDKFPFSGRFTVVDQVHFPAGKVRNFDALFQEGMIEDLDFIKLDTEGTELSIMQGGQKHVLPRVFAIQLEIMFIQKCINQPLFRHVDEFMAQSGFQLMDLRRQFWKRKNSHEYVGKGQLVFGDVLYVKTIEALGASIANMEPAQAKSKIAKAILISLVYRLCDYAAVLSEWAWERNYFSAQEHEEVLGVIRDYSKVGQWPQFPGRNLLYKVFFKLTEELRPLSYLGFSDGDRTIANIRDI